MSNVLLRRRGVGKTSCEGIARLARGEFEVVLNMERAQPVDGVLFRWGCTSTAGQTGVTVNSARAIHRVTDKPGTRRILMEAGVRVPRTFFPAVRTTTEMPTDGVIVRPAQHAGGRDLVYTKDLGVMLDALRRFGTGAYASEYIPKTREFRVYVVQGRVVAVAEKRVDDPTQVAWNHSQGGSFSNVKWGAWPMGACEQAIKGMLAVGLDFGGVDTIQCEAGADFVLEINSAPSLLSEYRTRCFARAFDWIVENGKETIPVDRFRAWRDVIHPAVAGEGGE